MTYGTLLTFSSKENFVKAMQTLDAQKIQFDCYASTEVEEMIHAPHSVFDKINLIKVAAFIGACLGLFTAILMQWYATVKDTPLNIAGKPLNSWPADLPICFVLTVFSTGLFLYAALFYRLKLPQPYHSVFNAKSYNLSLNQYSILIFADENIEVPRDLGADQVEVVPC